MRATIDAAGRLVIPKAIRAALGLTGGEELELHAADGRIEIEVAATPMRLERRTGDDLVAVPDEALPALTAAQVRATLESTRR